MKQMEQYNGSWQDTVFSDGSKLFLSKSNPKVGDEVEIKIRLSKDSPINRVFLRYLRNGERTIVPMNGKTRGIYDIYKTSIEINQREIRYHFILLTDSRTYFYNQGGLTECILNEDYDFKIISDFSNPEWTKDEVFYHIFVDRFCNGCEDNDVKDNEYEEYGYHARKIPWGEKPGSYDEFGNLNFYGGDLEGVEQKIPYLKDLGINALYLNPIFQSPSNHKYDCEDYFNVDKHFGGNEALVSLSNKLHENNMKIMLDISINHTGITNKWVKDKRQYYYNKEDGSLECWVGVKTLPVLNYNCKELQDVIYRNEDCVLKHYLKKPYNIDGWRFDVGHTVAKMDATQMDKELWQDVRKSIKDTNDDAYIIAEHWTDCSEYLQGNMWDGTMNYIGFMRPVRRYLGEPDKYIRWVIEDLKMKTGSADIFMREIMAHYGRLPFQMQKLQFNLLGSHDLPRFHHSKYLMHDGKLNKDNIKASIIMLLTFIGVPCIYYGDEILIDGEDGNDQGCRYCMDWDSSHYDKEIHDLYKKMISLRKSEEVLKSGSFKFIKADERILSYARFDDKTAIIYINSQDDEYKKLTLSLDSIGQAEKVQTILGREDCCILDNNNLHVYINSNENILLKIALK